MPCTRSQRGGLMCLVSARCAAHTPHPCSGCIKPRTLPPPRLLPAALPGPAAFSAPHRALAEQLEALLCCRFIALLQTRPDFVVWIADTHPPLTMASSGLAPALVQILGVIISIPAQTPFHT